MKHSVKSLLEFYSVAGFVGVFVKVLLKGLKSIFSGSSKMQSGWQKPIAVEICENVTKSEFRCHPVKEYLVITKAGEDDDQTQKEDIYPLA